MVTFCELMNNQPPIDVETECQEFNNSIASVRNILIKSATAVNTYKHLFPRKICERNEFLRQSQELSVISPSTPEIELQQKLFCDNANSIWLHINEECSNILGPIKNATDLINNAQHFLLENRLGKWKRDQVLAGYGDSGAKSSNLHDNNPHLKTALDEIQAQFEDLFECVWTTRILLKAIQDCHDQWQCSDPLEAKLASDITIIQQKLICSSFVVEEQPQVIHFDVKFQATVRLLLPKFVTVDPNTSSVSACLLSATQVQRQQQQWAPLNENSGGIAMKMNFGFHLLQQNRLICDLRHMKLKNIDRPPKGANESVMDEKFAILFECKLLIKNTPFNIWTTSLPVTVATNVSQDSEGWATITWDSSFFEIGRMPFVVRSEVPWSHMEWALKTRFNYQTGCTLTDEHLQYLYEKVFGSSSRQDRSITWTQFCKDNLIDRNFSFFNWFHEATKLTRLHLSKEWEKGLIHGFISKSKAEEMLRTCPAGTFLLRFSDSKLGGISVAWVENNADGSLNFEIMDPYLIKDFEIIKPFRSIGDFLRKLDVCTHLYPDKPKDLAFGEYYAPTTAAAANRCPNGYKPKIV